MSTFGFSEGDAKRIGRVVKLVERGTEKIALGGPGDKKATPGVRMMVGKAGTSSWSKGVTATVTIHAGAPGAEVTAGTVVAHNYFANINASTSTSYSRWVGLSNNGFGWLLIAAECD